MTVRVDQLGQLIPLGVGNQAHVYELPTFRLPGAPAPLVYKAYRDSVLTQRGMAIRHAMPPLIELPHNLSRQHAEFLQMRTAWPLVLVIDEQDGVRGIIMRKIPHAYYFAFHGTREKKRKLLSLLELLRPLDQIARYNIPRVNRRQLALLVARVAECIAFFHENGLVVGDLSPKNIVISNPNELDGQLHPKFLDTDSFRLHGDLPPIEQGDTHAWSLPEAHQASKQTTQLLTASAPPHEIARARARATVRDQRSDTFKFGLLVMRLFSERKDRAFQYLVDQHTLERIITTFGERRGRVLLSCLEESPKRRPNMADVFKWFRG